MAIQLKGKGKTVEQAPVVTAQPAAPANPLAYLSAEAQGMVAELPADVQELFAAQTTLTPDFVDTISESIPEELLGQLITDLEAAMAVAEPVPAVQVTAQAAQPDAAQAAKAKRDALKAEIAKNAKTTVAVPQQPEPSPLPVEVKDAAPTMPEALAFWGQLFPVNVPVTVINRGGGSFELHVGKVEVKSSKPAATVADATPKTKKVKVTSISNNPAYWTEEYKAFLEEMKGFADLDAKIAYAQSLGLVRGTDWADKTKAGEPMPKAIENMQLTDAIRNKRGIEIYIESARTSEQRRALAQGQAS